MSLSRLRRPRRYTAHHRPPATSAGRRVLLLVAAALLASCTDGCRRRPPVPQPPRPQAANVSTDPWTLATTSPYGNYGAYLGNGFLGMRFGATGTTDSPDGSAPSRAPYHRSSPLTCVVAGQYDGEHLADAPDWGRFAIRSTSQPVYPDQAGTADYRQTLDMRRGELTTSYTVPAGRPAFRLALVTRVHRDRPGLVTFAARVTPLAGGEIAVDCPDPAAPSAAGRIVVAARLSASDAAGRPWATRPGPRPGTTLVRVEPGVPLDLVRWVYVSAPGRGTGGAPHARLEALMRRGLPALVASHRAAWARLWQSDIQVDGDLEAQQTLRACLFYLLCSLRPGADSSIAPMGLSGRQWQGHVFWDADMWVHPAIGLLHPDLARSIVAYRQRTLAGARANARAAGMAGADFAMESGRTGREVAPGEFRDERHVTADVAIAQWRHYLLTRDHAWLARNAYPVLRDTAAWWQARAIYNAARGRYEIRHVIGPDETAGYVDNDIYTNAAARLNLRYAIQASRTLGRPAPAAWQAIADGLWLPFDPRQRLYVEHEGFSLERGRPKQADALLLYFPLGLATPPDVEANTLTHYAARTMAAGPAMTASVHAIVAADLARRSAPLRGPRAPDHGWPAEALRYFRESYRPHMLPPFQDFSEKRSMVNATFLTGCAGTLSVALYGFGGIRYDENGLGARPMLPPGWRRLRIAGLHHGAAVYELDVPAHGPARLRRTR